MTDPAEPMVADLDGLEALGLIADGWEIIESSGPMGEMTLQAPDDWDEPGPRERAFSFHALARRAQPGGGEESGWLVEKWNSKSGEFGAEWWSIHPSFEDGCGWTKDSSIALRFARQTDAQSYINEIGWTEAKPTEHAWIAAIRSPA